MTQELKPCPFCGSDELNLTFTKGHGDFHEYAWVSITCLNSDCFTEASWALYDADEWNEKSAMKLAAEHWNRRTPNEQIQP